MQPITPHLWFDKEAKEAAEFYVSLFPDSKITNITRLQNTPSGDCDVVSFHLAGQPFMAISAGPLFKFNPSISFDAKFATMDEIDAAWKRLADGGQILMPLGSYPFSERYGWVADRYGLSWQLMLASGSALQRTITPALLFTRGVCGKAEQAIRFYASVFPDSEVNILARYGKAEEPETEGTVKYASFKLLGQEFGAMDSAHEHNFSFNEAISFVVPCDTQAEIDYYWEKLSANPNAGQCGWLKDEYGLSWQITPSLMSELMRNNDPVGINRVTEAFLKMRKFDIAALQRAYEGH